jgi:dTMP kinase
MGLFITFEGGEGSGKSYQSRFLSNRLKRLAIPYVLIREPGGTQLGESIRHLLKRSPGVAISPLAELLLFNSSRSQLVADVIIPALNEDKIVICDRFSDSTVAYQTFGRGLDAEITEEVNRIATHGLKPHLTFLLDISPEVGLARKPSRSHDRFEQEELAFHRRVREGFLKLAADKSSRWFVIDSMLPKKIISQQVWEKVISFLQNSQLSKYLNPGNKL